MRVKTIGLIFFALFIASLAHTSHSHTAGETHSHSEETPKVTKTKSSATSQNDLWFQALVATAFIGVAPILVLFFIPLVKKEKGSEEISVNVPLLKTLLSFAVGGLLGDVFLHLLPHAMEAQGHDEEDFHSHSHNKGESSHDHHHDLSLGLLVLGGIMTFFTIEKIMRISSGNAGHSHSHQENDKTDKKSKKKEEKKI